MTSRRRIPHPPPNRPSSGAGPLARAPPNTSGVAERTVTEMVSDGRIVAYRLGGTIRFDLNEIDAATEPTTKSQR